MTEMLLELSEYDIYEVSSVVKTWVDQGSTVTVKLVFMWGCRSLADTDLHSMGVM